nr:AAA family ATPase [uncultured Flavobacterium sp.]
MNKERLVIKNFGPIKSIDLELGKMTILIGEQATGKSTVAKVLAVCRYFSYLITSVSTEESFVNFNNSFEEGLREWGLTDFIQNDSIIEYENENYSLRGRGEILNITKSFINNIEIPSNKSKYFYIDIQTKTEEFSELFNSIEAFKKNRTAGEFTKVPVNFYQNEVSKVMNNPFYVPTERGLQSIFSLGKSSIQNISDSLYNQFAKMDMFARNFKSETDIKPLEIVYKNISGQGFIKNKNQSEYTSLINGASGYQSTIPVVLAIKYYSEIRRKNKTFIIEEPELNLFPKAQKKLMEFFVENINTNGHSFLLPTHSPYFLSAINDLLLAYKKGQKNQVEVEKIIKKESWLNPDDFSVYQLKDGRAFDIFDKKTGLITENIIDDVSDEMNDEFDELLDIR